MISMSQVSRGRVKFAKYSRILECLSVFYKLFPRKIRLTLFVHHRKTKGMLGLAIRYALAKTLFKSLGENVSIHPDVVLLNVENLSIGSNVSIHPFSYIDAYGNIEIGNDVSIAHGVSLLSFEHYFERTDIPIKDQGSEKRAIQIDGNVWIGAKATVLGGCSIKEGSIVGAGAVVTHSIEEYSIACGIPAKVIRRR